MLLALVFILLLVGAAVVGSLYSNFIVFYKSFAEVDNYNKAYYASIAALERGELVTKQREPGYIGSGGWRGDVYINTDNNESDKIDGEFSYLKKSDDTNLFRDVNSRTQRIPRTGEGDVDWMLAYDDNYNKMDYENAEIFLLYYDKSVDTPYAKKSCSNTADCDDSKAIIDGKIRLPEKIKEAFGSQSELDYTSDSLVIGGNKNDEIVDWQLRGEYNGAQFTIFAQNKAIISGSVYKDTDSVIRESNINAGVDLNFGGDAQNGWRRQPNKNVQHDSNLIYIGSQQEENLNNKNFRYILNNNYYSRLNLRLSLLNLLKSKSKKIYPYLEYYLSFSSPISDKYFRINGEGRYKDYQVNIIMYKPTVKESVLGNFTVIF